jgi:hypothetical protein
MDHSSHDRNPQNHHASLWKSCRSSNNLKNDDNINNPTRQYRQKLMQLAATSSPTQIGWLVSQHVLDRLWTSQQWSHQDGTKKSFYQAATSSSGDTGSTTDKVFYACQQCGNILHPGWRGSHLRVKTRRRKRTKILPPSFTTTLAATTSTSDMSQGMVLRRELRAHRRRQQHYQPTAVVTATTRTATTTAASGVLETQTLAASRVPCDSSGIDNVSNPRLIFHLLEDDVDTNSTSNHYLELTCGRCHGKVALNGVKRQQPQRRRQHRENVSVSTPKTKKQPKTSLLASSSTTIDGSLSRETDTHEVEFVALPPNESKRKRSWLESGDALVAGLPVKVGPTNRTTKTKIKKRKGSPMKSKLTDFLSSLNDP